VTKIDSTAVANETAVKRFFSTKPDVALTPVGFSPCSCSDMKGIECAADVADCAAECVGTFGTGCLDCVEAIGDCCPCASDFFGFDCSDCP
jgi:hypothetical protein